MDREATKTSNRRLAAASLCLTALLAGDGAGLAQAPQTAPATPAPQQPATPTPPATPAPSTTTATPAPETAAPAAPTLPPMRVLRTGGMRMETAALLMSGQEGGPLPFSVLAIPLEAQGDKVRVPLLIEVDGSPLLDEHAEGPLRLDVSLYALAGGSIQGSLANTVEVDPLQMADAVEKSGFQFLGELALKPGEYSLRVLVKNPSSDSIGLRTVPLLVPDLKAGQRVLLPPLFYHAADDSWVAVEAVEARGRSPLQALGLAERPGARPILSLDKEVEVVVPAYHLGEPGELRMEVRRANDEMAADLPLRITGRKATAVPGLELVSATFTPREIESGGYNLRVKVAGEPQGRPPGTSVILAQGEVGGRVWAEFTRSKRQMQAGGGEGTPVRTAQQQIPARRKKPIDVAPTKAAYLEALRALATGRDQEARLAVMQLEEKVLETGGSDSEDLAQLQADMVQGIAKSDPVSMLPILVFHQDLYLRYWSQGHHLRSTHSRQLFLRLIEIYASLDKSEEGKKTASRYLLSLANDLSVTTVQGIRRRVLDRAVELDGQNPLILLCLAVDAEHAGDSSAAMGFLERLQRLRPDDGEVKTRMAVNYRRLRRSRDEKRMFQAVVDGPVPDEKGWWWHSLAHQELAKIALESKDFKRAEEILRKGIKHWPADEKMRLQLAALLDQRRDPQEAQALLEGIQPAEGQRGWSPRHHYTQYPFDALQQDTLEIRKAAAQRIPALAAAVQVQPATQPATQGGAR